MRHKPVLLKEIIENLNLKDNGIYLDLTLGSAGHCEAVCKLGLRNLTIVGIDKDQDAINRSSVYLENCEAKLILEELPNYLLDEVLNKHEIENIDSIVLDLGISSEQIDVSGRGFTFQKDEPLMMTMKKNPGATDLTAEIILNTFEEETLADIIFGYGEETFARKIAKSIVDLRKERPFKTTFDLVEAVQNALPKKAQRGKIHPATKTFQAIRMAVNDEFGSLPITLIKAFDHLKSGGRFLIISFHSIEDRIIKNWIKEKVAAGVGEKINKKPLPPTEEEIKNNPRSRSAKLRIIQKL
jgi:16S rRNA (cytosine1402-N4)-methyltransferase